MENRLVELETRLAFQDDALQALNAVVVRQQQEIAALAYAVEDFKSQLRAMAPASVASRADEPPPPHY
jgi:SlyX protein